MGKNNSFGRAGRPPLRRKDSEQGGKQLFAAAEELVKRRAGEACMCAVRVAYEMLRGIKPYF